MHFRLSIIVVVLFQQLALSQAPKQFNFQGVAIDSGGFIVSQKPIKIRFTFSGDSTLTKLSYQELVNARTDQFGQFTCMIGSGLALKGAFDSIPFSTGKVYLKTEMDINSSGIYINAGTSKLASVPYAYFASNAVGLKYFKIDQERRNVSIGDSALITNLLPSNSVAVGIGALGSKSISGFSNTAIGNYSLNNNQNGYNNTAIGVNAGLGVITGQNNIFIGANSGRDTSFKNLSYKLIIDPIGTKTPLIEGDFLNKSLKINGDLEVTGTISGNKKINATWGAHKFGDTLLIEPNSDVLETFDGAWNRVYILPAPTQTNKYLSNRINTSILINCQSSFSFKISKSNTDMIDDLTLNTGEYAIFLFDRYKWLKIGGKNIANSTIINSFTDNNGNTAIGQNSLIKKTSGTNNSAFGTSSLTSNTIGSNNSSFGSFALMNNSTGNNNTAIGSGSLENNTKGTENTAVGKNSLYSTTIGISNTAIGNQSLSSNTSGNSNIAIGHASLYSNTTGGGNVAIGFEAMLNNTTNTNLVAIGTESLRFNTKGYNLTAVGSNSLRANTTGYYNTALGSNALQKNSVGSDNEAIGINSLSGNISGNLNTAIGGNSLLNNIDGIRNVTIGHATLESNLSGSNNTSLGSYSAQKWASGNRNTIIGANSANTILNGSNNIIIGADAGNYATSLNNKLIISNSSSSEPLIYGDFDLRTVKFNQAIDSPVVWNRLYFEDAYANTHINKYEKPAGGPMIYARYFYGGYKDLIMQGMNGRNIHFVTNIYSNDPTQRMVIMDKGNIGIGNFVDDAPKAKLEVKDGDVFISNPTKGIILKSPNGSCWRVTIDDTGNFVRTSISCPTY